MIASLGEYAIIWKMRIKNGICFFFVVVKLNFQKIVNDIKQKTIIIIDKSACNMENNCLLLRSMYSAWI